MRDFTIPIKRNKDPIDEVNYEDDLVQSKGDDDDIKTVKEEDEDSFVVVDLQDSNGEKTEKYFHYKSENNTLFAIVAFFIFVVIGLGTVNILLAVRYFNAKSPSGTDNVLGASTNPNTSNSSYSIPSHLEDKIIYTDRYNLFISEKDGKNVVQLTNYPNQKGSELQEIELIDENTVGYFRCTGLALNPMCEIITADIQTGNTVIEEKLRSNNRIQLLTWIDPHAYAYTVTNASNEEYSLVFKSSFGRKDIANFPLTGIPRVKTHLEDSARLLFSPDGTKILLIDTKSRGGFDFTIFVYDTSGSKIDTMRSATDPIWINDTSIVYRAYSNENAGYFYIRDVSTKTIKRVEGIQKSVYDPEVFRDELVYWENVQGGTSYFMDVENNSSSMISDYAAYPIWLSDHEIILHKTRNCALDECMSVGTVEFETQFITDHYFVYDTKSQQREVIDLSSQILGNGIITWHHRHMYSYSKTNY